MALINCSECNKNISDKALSCPGCGCPVELDVTNHVVHHIDYNNLGSSELWHKAYNIQYKGRKKDLPIAIDIYKYIIAIHSKSKEAEYAKLQLSQLLDTNIEDMNNQTKMDYSSHCMILVDSDNEYVVAKCSKCHKQSKIKKTSTNISGNSYKMMGSGTCSCGISFDEVLFISSNISTYNDSAGVSVYENNNRKDQIASNSSQPERKNINDIPTHGGLVALAVILGFGFFGGIALGCYTNLKRLIRNGDYDGALRVSKETKSISLTTICIFTFGWLILFTYILNS